MKKILFIFAIFTFFVSCKKTTSKKAAEVKNQQIDSTANQVIEVAAFKGQQVTGVTVSDAGRIFVNFPRWRKGVDDSVVEITNTTVQESYPDENWNSWEIGQPVVANKFVGVQSVFAFENQLYVLDTRSQLFENVLDAPRIFVFDLTTDKLVKTYVLDKNSYHPDSYINDLRIDKKTQKIYLTDSGNSGIVIIDIKSGRSRRVLDNHKSTAAEQGFLTFGDKKWKNTIHSDGIALDTVNDRLYFHALTGYSLYSIATNMLNSEDEKSMEKSVRFEAKTAAPDGMLFDDNGNLYFADLENNKIQYRKPDGSIHTLIEGDMIKWADTFSIYNNYLYFTNSRINEVTADISNLTFTLNKIKLAK